MFGYLLEVFGLVGRKVFLCHKKSSASVVNRFVLLILIQNYYIKISQSGGVVYKTR